ncbi:hypothetical protein ACIRSF_06460 [Streptomyces rubiginosohelvolus]|uniref:hypothetical protein n=1 Tax=Streptomyces rubiginosohelvolus TaxID=67362 RepID=UPI003812825C
MGRKSFRKVPDAIRAKISALGSDSYQVGFRGLYPVAQIETGALEHLGIRMESGSPQVPPNTLPLASRGRHSRWNLTGKVVRRIDLPKVHRTWGVETPNFGDWGRGSHTITFTRLVYPTEIAYGQQIPVLMTPTQQDDDEIAIAFRVGQVLDRSEPDDHALIFALSLLQENVGGVDVVESETSSDEWLKSVSVAWEFLPVGKRDSVLTELAHRIGISPDDPRRSAMEERMSTLLELSPTELIYGTSGFQRYIGARFSPSLVVFENVEYGNALYVMFEDWEGLSRRSRLELLAGPTRGFERIPHRRGWEGRLRQAVNSRRDESP